MGGDSYRLYCLKIKPMKVYNENNMVSNSKVEAKKRCKLVARAPAYEEKTGKMVHDHHQAKKRRKKT